MINHEAFMRYENVRKSGVTNMFMIGYVCELTNLSRNEVHEIMVDYDLLSKQYLKD